MKNPFRNYLNLQSSVSHKMKDNIIGFQSTGDKDLMCVVLEAATEAECQGLIQHVMENTSQATFTLPVKTAIGSWIAQGHYSKSENMDLI